MKTSFDHFSQKKSLKITAKQARSEGGWEAEWNTKRFRDGRRIDRYAHGRILSNNTEVHLRKMEAIAEEHGVTSAGKTYAMNAWTFSIQGRH